MSEQKKTCRRQNPSTRNIRGSKYISTEQFIGIRSAVSQGQNQNQSDPTCLKPSPDWLGGERTKLLSLIN